MKITPGTLWNTLFALWTSNNDPKEAKWTPSGSLKSQHGAQRLPKAPKGSPKGTQKGPKGSHKRVKKWILERRYRG